MITFQYGNDSDEKVIEDISALASLASGSVLSMSSDAYKSLLSGDLKLNIYPMGHNKLIENCKIEIKAKSGVYNLRFSGKGSTVIIGEGVYGFYDLRLWRKSNILIGDRTSSNGIRIITDNSGFKCGSDCMFSDSILAQTSDQHGIVDLESGEIINNKYQTVELGDHVWLGRNSTVMSGVQIGNGSIVGSGSIVTKDVLQHTLVAGIPAKVLKTKVTWSRSPVNLDSYSTNMIRETSL